jgi:hypothetical protein
MPKHPLDHDRNRDDAKVARQYARIERESASGATDPKIRAMTNTERTAEVSKARLKAFLKIEREKADT